MATFSQSGQNLKYKIPDYGQVFLSNSENNFNAPDNVFYRTPQGIGQLSIRNLGESVTGQRIGGTKANGSPTQYREIIDAGAREFERLSGITLSSLARQNTADSSQAFGQAGTTQQNIHTDVAGFLQGLAATQKGGGDITKNPSLDNPQGSVVSVDGRIAQQSPSTQQALLTAGATSDQAATLAAYQQGMRGTGATLPNGTVLRGGTPAYPQQLLDAVGATPKPQQYQAQSVNQGGIPSIPEIMSNPGAYGAQTNPVNATLPNTFGSDFVNSALGNPKTGSDILSQIYSQYQGFQKDYISALQQSAQEQQAQQQIDNLQQGELQGQVNIEGQRIPMPLIGGQLDEFKKQIAFQQIPLEQKLKRLTTERQGKLDSLKAQMGFGEKALDIALQLQKMSKPDVVSTQVNKDTGDVYSVVQNADGSLVTSKVGNVGATAKEKNYTNTGTYRDSNNNEVFWGLTQEGKVETKVLGKVAGTVTEQRQGAQGSLITKALAALNKSKGKDGYTNPDIYRDYKRQYIAAGGTPSDFFQSLPVEQFISPDNRKGDLAGATSAGFTPGGSLGQEQVSVVNDANAALDRAKQLYQDVPALRSQIIQRSIQQYGFDPSPYLK